MLKIDQTAKLFLQILLSVDETGLLVCVDGTRCPVVGCKCWILSVPLADDCHAYNCRLSLMAAGTVRLYTTAAVVPGQQLKMWFPPDLQLMLHVPFLTPVNIKGERYRSACLRRRYRHYTRPSIIIRLRFTVCSPHCCDSMLFFVAKRV